MKDILFPILLVLPLSTACSQFIQNLDFESHSTGWETGGVGYTIDVDTSISHAGKGSLRMTYNDGKGFSFASQAFSADQTRGKKRILLSGFVKTENVTEGYAGLWLRLDGQSGPTKIDNMQDRGIVGSTDWQKCQIQLDADTSTIRVVFGTLFTGKGSAWFDDLGIEIDGVPHKAELPPLDTSAIHWLRESVIPLKGVHANSGFNDLKALKPIIANSRIVALGEATHGTSEFFRIKHRLLEFFASEMGFTVFAIEANMPEAYRLNDYVLTGKGDPKELLRGMYFWTWNTQEVLDMIQWMRQFNQSGRGRIRFTGFDMQTPTVARQIVSDFLRKTNESFNTTADSLFVLIDSASVRHGSSTPNQYLDSALRASEQIYDHIIRFQARRYPSIENDTTAWAVQNARIIVQSLRLAQEQSQRKFSGLRDSCMAENVRWILEHSEKNAKIILWAHNGHISKSDFRWMGAHLRKSFGDDYIPISITCHEGNYTAVQLGKGLASHPLTPSFPGSAELYFQATRIPVFFLSLGRGNALPEVFKKELF